MTNSDDTATLIAQAPMSRLQIIVVAMTVALTALDGFDVLSISFASPGIATEWGVDFARLGVILSMELLGMAAGSVLLGRTADRIGRRRTIMICLIIMTIGMFAVTRVSTLEVLSAWRVFTGLGIGGLLATSNAVAAEFSNQRRRFLSVSLMTIGYPIGAVVGGMIAAQLLQTFDWRSVFYLGTVMTAGCIPLVIWLVPESVQWLTIHQPDGALQRINRTLKRMGHAELDALPAMTPSTERESTHGLFTGEQFAKTLLVTAAFFFHITTFYFLIKWIPKLVVDMGYETTQGVSVLVWTNVGGVFGGAIVGLLTLRYNVKRLAAIMMLLSVVLVIAFGQSMGSLTLLSAIAIAAGFATNGAIVGLYSLFAHVYPTRSRASGTGFSIGIGRGGAMLAPILAGVLLQANLGIPRVAIVMSLFSLMAFAALHFLKTPDLDRQDDAPSGIPRTAGGRI